MRLMKKLADAFGRGGWNRVSRKQSLRTKLA